MHAVIIKASVVEITEHGLVGCVLHRSLVLRRAPQTCFRLMAACTCLAPNETCLRQNLTSAPLPETKTGSKHKKYCDRNRGPDQARGENGGF
jgi:hypothetical protein